MDFIEQPALRSQTEQRRQAPVAPRVVAFSFGRGGRFDDPSWHGPMQLCLEATDSGGAIAVWLDDGWWAEALQRWGDDPVTLSIAPTREALLHPVVLHQLEMVRRVAPLWRVLGVAFPGDVSDDSAVQCLASSPYHEVRFIDAARNMRPGEERTHDERMVPELFAKIRRELELRGRGTPILVRIPASQAAQYSGAAI